MCISHVGIPVQDGHLDKMVDWYLTVLAPLGYVFLLVRQRQRPILQLSFHHRYKKLVDLRPAYPVVGLGEKYADFWLTNTPTFKPSPDEKLHIAFYSRCRQQIRDFHAAAMKIGSKDNGGPGLRPHYASTYYGAFVFDPEGRNVEVHSVSPGFWGEPTQRNILMSALGVAAAVGISYFANLGGYLGSWAM
ncbi:hypothetical protein FRC16_002783 [Serendipita sp. 398]|nr:hypothetical protein FRC16_002783 [Serendipita sp. 398]